MKKLLPLWAALFFVFSCFSAVPAYAGENYVTVTYRFEDKTLASSSVPSGTEITPMSYTTAKNHIRQNGSDLTNGTVYEWRLSSPTGEVTDSFIADTDTTLFFVASAVTNKTVTVTYRYDYINERSFISESIDYLYGEEYRPPEKINGKDIERKMFLSPAYKTADNNMWNAPAYIQEDKTVYVVLTEPARITLNGEAYSTPYGQSPVPPQTDKNFRHVGFFTDPEYTKPFSGAAVNGIALYSQTERVYYSLTTISSGKETEWTIPIDDAVVTKDILSEKYIWTDENGDRIAVPYEMTRDTVLKGNTAASLSAASSDDPTPKTLTSEEIAAVVIVAVVFVAIGVYSLLRYLLKKGKLPKRKKKTDNPDDKEV